MLLIMVMGVAAVVGDFYALQRDGCFEYIKRRRAREKERDAPQNKKQRESGRNPTPERLSVGGFTCRASKLT